MGQAAEDRWHIQDMFLIRGQPLDIQGKGVGKNFEMNEFLLQNDETKYIYICSQALYLYSVTENVNKKMYKPLSTELIFYS